METDLKHRWYKFSLSVVLYLKNKNWNQLSSIVVKQLMRSACSVGANVVEAKNSSTRLEFKRFYEIALKSCNESKYWICLLRDGFDMKDESLDAILQKAKELANILASSIIKLKQTG